MSDIRNVDRNEGENNRLSAEGGISEGMTTQHSNTYTVNMEVITQIKQEHTAHDEEVGEISTQGEADEEDSASDNIAHIQTYNTDTGNVCKICDKSFAGNLHLKRHIKLVHEGERAHQCSVCEKTFSQASHLRKHIKIVHQGERNHQCSICDKTFGEAGSLRSSEHK